MADLMANLEIFISNFNAGYGRTLNLLLPIAALLVLMALALRTAAVGAKAHRQPLPSGEEGDKQRLAEGLAEAVRIPTVSGRTEELARLRAALAARYALVFERTEDLAPGAPYILRRLPGSDKSAQPVLLCAHMDVVPVSGDWGDLDPFSGEIREGVLYGRGAVDCKGSLIAILDSLQQELAAGLVPQGDVYIAFGHDEEIGGPEGAVEMARILRERGLRFRLILDEGTPVYRDILDSTDCPAALIAIGEKGCCYYNMTAAGTAGHASVPPRHTALGILAEAICRVEAAPPRTRLLPQLDHFWKQAAGAMSFGKRFLVTNLPLRPLLTLAFRDDKYLLPLLRTTMAVTQAAGADAPNVLPGTATAVINGRLLAGDTPAAMLERLQSLVRDLPVTVEMTLENPPSALASPDSAGYKLVEAAVAASMGEVPCLPAITTVATDSRHYSDLSDTVLKFVPIPVTKAEYAAMHGAPERVDLDSLALCGAFYRALLKSL